MQQQFQQEKAKKEEVLRQKEEFNRAAWDQMMRAERYKRECGRLQGEIGKVQAQVRRLEIFIEESINTLPSAE